MSRLILVKHHTALPYHRNVGNTIAGKFAPALLPGFV